MKKVLKIVVIILIIVFIVIQFIRPSKNIGEVIDSNQITAAHQVADDVQHFSNVEGLINHLHQN